MRTCLQKSASRQIFSCERDSINWLTEKEKGPEDGPFSFYFFLPVGLADLMSKRYGGFTKPSTGNVNIGVQKKGRTG